MNSNIIKNQLIDTDNLLRFKFGHRLIHININANNKKLVPLNKNLLCCTNICRWRYSRVISQS